jgi:hypothetical protein
MLKKFLLTAGIAAGVFGLCIGMLALLGLWDIENIVLVGVLYYAAFYLVPATFLVGVIGSIVCAVRSMRVKRI